MAGLSKYYDPSTMYVSNGDIIDESDINNINTALDTSFELIETDISLLTSSQLVKQVTYQLGTRSITGEIPADGTQPQYNEGTSVTGNLWDLTYSSIYPISIVSVEVDLNLQIECLNSSFDTTKPIGCIALFEDSSNDAKICHPIISDVYTYGSTSTHLSSSIQKQYKLIYQITTTSTSTFNFMVRVAPSNSSDFSFILTPDMSSFYSTDLGRYSYVRISEYKTTL